MAGRRWPEQVILDTCYLIDLERKRLNATEFLAQNHTEALSVTVVNAGELACGFDAQELPKLWPLLRQFQILEITLEAAAHYASIYRALRASGNLIGGNDMWIASIALANKLPIVTNNIRDFSRIPSLRVISY